ncbi:MAG: hypothetical protein SGPRY_007637 [Prymnesium sp.]
MQLAAAHVSFIAVRRASQHAQLSLGVSTRLAILPSLCGAATVAAGAVASVVASDVVCRVVSDSRVSWKRRLQRYSIKDIALAGIGIYAVLNRGRFWTLSPSCLQAPGAFARVRAQGHSSHGSAARLPYVWLSLRRLLSPTLDKEI